MTDGKVCTSVRTEGRGLPPPASALAVRSRGSGARPRSVSVRAGHAVAQLGSGDAGRKTKEACKAVKQEGRRVADAFIVPEASAPSLAPGLI